MDDPTRSPVWFAIIVVMILIELAWRRRARRGTDRGATLTTLGIVAAYVPIAALTAACIGVVFRALWAIAPLHLPMNQPATWIAGFVAVEFAYYWFHRASHRVRWMWATHAVHHSAEQMVLLSSLRLGWTNLISAGWIFYLPLIGIGFDPRLVVALLSFNLHYQFFLHTEARVRLGPLEYLLNSPSHHRIHHATDADCRDRNYGGVLILFDRLFGSFTPEPTAGATAYGLVAREREANPVRLAFREWRLMAGELWRAQGVAARLRIALGAP